MRRRVSSSTGRGYPLTMICEVYRLARSYIGEPQCNGVIERFMRTLKEQCLYLHRFQNLEEARRVRDQRVHHPLQLRVAH